MVDKIHIRNLFRIFVPLTTSLGAPRMLVSFDESSDSGSAKDPRADAFGIEFSNNKQVKIKLLCTDYYGNVKDEVKDCFSWAKRSAVIYQKNEENSHVTGMFMRMKISQGVFDFRKTRERLFRIVVDLHEDNVLTRTGTSAIMKLYPKKRHVETENEGNEVIVPIYWFGEDGYLVDKQPYVSPEHDSPLSIQKSSNSGNTPYQFTVSPEGDLTPPVHEIKFEDAIFDDDVTHSNQFSLVPNIQASNNNENYMVLYNGNAEVVGNFRALNFYKASDINLKEDIQLLDSSRDCRASLLQINGVSYKFKQGVSHATNKRFIGYIAQQIESVVPEATQLIDGILHVDYESLIPYLSESIKQNYGDIQNVTSEVDKIKQTLDALYGQFTGTKPRPYPDAVLRRRSNSTARTVFSWITGVVIVATLLAWMVVFLFFTGPPHHPARPTLEHVVPVVAVDERQVLIDLFNFLCPLGFSYYPRWNFSAPHCSWAGITCNSTTGRVTAINISGMAYGIRKSPYLPESFGNLTELQELDLSHNYIDSEFPAPITRLKNLVSLNLQTNLLNGKVPDLRNLSKLKTMWLQNNLLEGPLDMLLQLPALESLVIRDNALVNSVLPETVSASLLELEIGNSGISGTIPESWASSNLVAINLSQNMLNGSVPCFGPNLVRFSAAYNQLNGEFCGQSLKNLQELDINNNALTGTFDLPGVDVANMTTLMLRNNQFSSFMPSFSEFPPGVGPLHCSAAFNEFKCPVPMWTVRRCKATCSSYPDN